MSRDVNGNYTLPVLGNPVVGGTTILEAWANGTLNDLASAMTDSLSRTGLGGMLAAFKLADGVLGAPGLSFTNESTTGIARLTASSWSGIAAGVRAFNVGSTRVDFLIPPTYAADPGSANHLTRKSYVDNLHATPLHYTVDTNAANLIWSETTTVAAPAAVDQVSGGLLLTSYGMNISNPYTPGVMFGSTDPQFTTTNPRRGAGIFGAATETYAADIDGGMGLDFFVTPNNPGVNGALTSRLFIDQDGSIYGDNTKAFGLGINTTPSGGLGLKVGGGASFQGTTAAVTFGYAFGDGRLTSSGAINSPFSGMAVGDIVLQSMVTGDLWFGGSAGAWASFESSGQFKFKQTGRNIWVKEGANARMGAAVLVAGTVTVATTEVTANSRIFLTSQVNGGTPGFLRVSARSAGATFTILSSSGTDTSTVAWFMVDPA